MLTLNLPNYKPKVTQRNGKNFIFDPLRRKEVALTPEEWVRQCFVNYLIVEKNYPRELVANEVTVSLNHQSKRCDTVVYNRYIEPLAIVEYKAPTVSITQEVFEQIARYNLVLRVNYLIVSNGLEHYCCRLHYETATCEYLKEIPDYHTLTVSSH
ncbi:MAG: type I restriction enzyme HsdR N-terminal domain-containing protein [Tannerella sp.]|jgi:hypothetical protein|nr:type I restriction enzyme HsdR N-terminal domain-containing protein [Tannerella sp.]